MLRATGELDYSMCAVVASLKNSFNLTYSHYTHFTYFISDDRPVSLSSYRYSVVL